MLNISSLCSVFAKRRITSGLIPQLDNAGCYLVTILRDIVGTRAGKGVGALQLSVLVPVLMRQSYLAASPNTRSIFLGLLATTGVHLFAQFVGLGVSLATLGLVLLALGSSAQLLSGGPETSPVIPTPARAVYWSNFLVVLVSFAVGLQGALSPWSSAWSIVAQVYIAYPVLLVLPLLFLARLSTARTPRDPQEAHQELLKYSAEQVSYSFERTWSYYRKVALISAGFYWYGLNRILRGLYSQNEQLSGPVRYILLNYALAALYCVLAVLIERTTIRPVRALHHPLTGKPRPQLVADCLKAISLAPAGSPGMERGIWEPMLTGIIAGPGAAAALWWSGEEEENGWYSRRAWREAAATSKKQ